MEKKTFVTKEQLDEIVKEFKTPFIFTMKRESARTWRR